MSLPLETLLELMALSDGELTGEAKGRAEALVNTDAQARETVDTMRTAHIGAWLKESLESKAALAGADRISDAVVSKLSTFRSERTLDRVARPSRRRWSLGARVGFGVTSTGLALAAAVLLYVGRDRVVGHGSAEADLRAPSVDSALSGATTPRAVEQVASSEGVIVDEIDSPSHSISLFEITSAGGPSRAASVVIWIEDEQGAK
jgi:hypothetical protein